MATTKTQDWMTQQNKNKCTDESKIDILYSLNNSFFFCEYANAYDWQKNILFLFACSIFYFFILFSFGMNFIRQKIKATAPSHVYFTNINIVSSRVLTIFLLKRKQRTNEWKLEKKITEHLHIFIVNPFFPLGFFHCCCFEGGWNDVLYILFYLIYLFMLFITKKSSTYKYHQHHHNIDYYQLELMLVTMMTII